MAYLGMIDGKVYPAFPEYDGICGDCGKRSAAWGDWLCPECRRRLEQEIAEAGIEEEVCDGDPICPADHLVTG
ncbi:MAG TPA: hypothetical protein G4O02_16945 [Caldilineae bacterium]|nr:hypothetical protein [Caldilineae bacterium]